jgi:hypothetical protein
MPGLAAVRTRLEGKGPRAARDWLDAVERDHEYQALRRGARDPLALRFLVRTALIGPGRTPFVLDRKGPAEDRPDAREVILLSLRVASRHVDEFGRTVGGSAAVPLPRPA